MGATQAGYNGRGEANCGFHREPKSTLGEMKKENASEVTSGVMGLVWKSSRPRSVHGWLIGATIRVAELVSASI